MHTDWCLSGLQQLYNIIFFGDHRTANLAVPSNSRPSFDRSRKMVPDLPQWKTNFNFYYDILQKYMYGGPKSM
jgi:hypothetical protein